MNVIANPNPVKISHRVVYNAGKNEWEKVLEETSALLVVRIKKSQASDQNMIRLQAAQKMNQYNVRETQCNGPNSALHFRAG